MDSYPRPDVIPETNIETPRSDSHALPQRNATTTQLRSPFVNSHRGIGSVILSEGDHAIRVRSGSLYLHFIIPKSRHASFIPNQSDSNRQSFTYRQFDNINVMVRPMRPPLNSNNPTQYKNLISNMTCDYSQ
jgi:hypothetical protein